MSTNKTANYGLNHWVLSDKPVMAEFNRDNELVDAQLKKLWDGKVDTATLNTELQTLRAGKADAAPGAWSFYVSKGGSNATADGTQAKPFLTIQAAINYAGMKVAGGFKQILIEDGVYEERVDVVGFDRLVIRGISGNRNGVVIRPPAGDYGVVLNGIALCTISDLTIRKTGGNSALYVMGCCVEARNLALIGDGEATVGAAFNLGATGAVYESEFSNFHQALRSAAGSTLHAISNTGSGNNVAFAAHGAIIFHEGTVPVADRMTAAASGGQICS